MISLQELHKFYTKLIIFFFTFEGEKSFLLNDFSAIGNQTKNVKEGQNFRNFLKKKKEIRKDIIKLPNNVKGNIKNFLVKKIKDGSE